MRETPALTLAVLLSGCSAFANYAPPPDSRHAEVAWRPTFAVAQVDAARLERPILAIFIAGARDGDC